MRVALNCVFFVPGEMGGMETYARELMPRLAAFGVEPVAFVPREAAREDFGVETVVVGVDARDRLQWVRGEQMLLPGLARRAGCSVVHSLASTAPLRGRFRRVVTVHDLHYRTAPAAHFGLRARGMAALVPAGARRADHVVTDSRQVAGEIEHLIGLAPEKVSVVPLGVSAPAGPATPEAELRARLGLGERPVVLSTGGTRPHKNGPRLAAAVDGLDAALVVTGYPTPEDARLPASVVRTGHVSRADLDGLYALARVVCAPSLAEGFGLPVLEAMVRGVPVACSDRGALAEVAGDAAALFDPEDEGAIRAVLGRLLGDAAERARLRAAGHARAALFTWDETARRTADVYAAVLATRRR